MSHIDKHKHNEYHRKYQKERYHRLRQEAITKLGNKCVVCGSTELLEIDHIEYTQKELPISRLWSVSSVKFWAEIEKCQLLCQNHHLEKTKQENKTRRPITHGKYWAAYKYKCTCQLCQQYKKDVNLKRKKARASNSNG